MCRAAALSLSDLKQINKARTSQGQGKVAEVAVLFLLESWHSSPLLNEVQRGHLVRVFLISSFYFTALGGVFLFFLFAGHLGTIIGV